MSSDDNVMVQCPCSDTAASIRRHRPSACKGGQVRNETAAATKKPCGDAAGTEITQGSKRTEICLIASPRKRVFADVAFAGSASTHPWSEGAGGCAARSGGRRKSRERRGRADAT